MKTFIATSFILLNTLMLSAQEISSDMAPPKDQGLWQTVTMIAIAMAFFYLILWRPEQKRRKVLEEQRNGLKKNDRVIAMGIIGTVVRVQEQTVILKMVDGAKIEVLKGAVTEVLPPEETGKIKTLEVEET